MVGVQVSIFKEEADLVCQKEAISRTKWSRKISVATTTTPKPFTTTKYACLHSLSQFQAPLNLMTPINELSLKCCQVVKVSIFSVITCRSFPLWKFCHGTNLEAVVSFICSQIKEYLCPKTTVWPRHWSLIDFIQMWSISKASVNCWESSLKEREKSLKQPICNAIS